MVPAMTRPRVRPRFRRWATIAGTCVALLLVHTLWDYSEARALQSALVTLAPDDGASIPRPGGAAWSAAPYYVAAGILAARSPSHVARGIGDDRKALQREPPGAAVVERVGMALAREDDVFRLLDRAAELDFRGFGSLRVNLFDLFTAKLLASLRALHAAAMGDGDAAAASILTQLRLEGAERSPISTLTLDTWLLNWRSMTVVEDIRVVLSRTEPSAASLEQLAAALADADEDTRIARFFHRSRDRLIARSFYRLGPYDGSFAEAGLFGDGLLRGRPGLFARIVRPLVARDLRGRLRQYGALLEAARSPWPGRSDAIVEAGARIWSIRRPFGSVAGLIYSVDGWLDDDPEGQRRQLHFAVADIALVRAARVAVAIERHRRDNAGQLPTALTALAPRYLAMLPIDPFSGEPMHFAATTDGYVVYSVGANGQDDGGDQVDAPPFPVIGPNSEARMTGDVGVSIRLTRD